MTENIKYDGGNSSRDYNIEVSLTFGFDGKLKEGGVSLDGMPLEGLYFGRNQELDVKIQKLIDELGLKPKEDPDRPDRGPGAAA